MNPSLISTPHPNLCTHSSKLEDQALSAQDSSQNHTSRDMESAPTLPEASQGLEGRKIKDIKDQRADPERIEKILELMTQKHYPLEDNLPDWGYFIGEVFFKDTFNQGCYLEWIYTHNRIDSFEQVLYKITLAVLGSIFRKTPLPIADGKTLDLNYILKILADHLGTIGSQDERSDKIIKYLSLYIVLSACYEPLIEDEQFSEYSQQRIAALEKLWSYLGPWTDSANVRSAFARIHKTCVDDLARWFKHFQENDPKRLSQLKKAYACWLMTPLKTLDNTNLLILDCFSDAGVKAKLQTGFQERDIDFDAAFTNNPQFIALLLKTQCDFFENTESFYSADKPQVSYEKPTARVYLLKKLESLGLKPENIQKHHPILEFALELKDPELLRHLILEYKFNPYYISDTTGHSLWPFMAEPNDNYSDKFQREAASILKRFEIKYYTVQDGYHLLNAEVKEIAINKKIPQTFNINQQNQWGETPLIRAAKFGYDAKHLFAFKELDLAIKDETDKTALDYAKENNNKALVKHIEEHKRALTTIRLINSLAGNGAKDNYQGLIGFLHKKGNDGLSVIEKAYQAQNFLLIEAIEAHLMDIGLHFDEYARTQGDKGMKPLDIKTVLKYKKTFVNHPHQASINLTTYIIYYYHMHAYNTPIGFSDENLNEAIYDLIGLASDVSRLKSSTVLVLSGLIKIYIIAYNKAKNAQHSKEGQRLIDIQRKAYKNIAHWLASPICIQNQTSDSFIINLLNNESIHSIHSIEAIRRTGLNLKIQFFNDTRFIEDVLTCCRQSLVTYRSNAVTIIQKLKELGSDLNMTDETGQTLLHLAMQFNEIDLFKYLILEELLNPFKFNNEGWSCVSYCRKTETLPMRMLDTELMQAFSHVWEEEIEPVLMKQYLDLPAHSPKNPRVDLIAQGKIPATLENINLQNQWGETPLIFAVKYGYEVANLLTIAGINIEMKDKFKKTALIYAELNKDERSEELIRDYAKKQNKTSQIFAAVNTIYQKKVANADQPLAKKLSAKQIKKAERARLKKAEQAKKQEQAKAAHTNDKTVDTPIAQRNTQKLIPPSITITIPELLNQQADNLVYQELPQEPSPIQKAKEKIAQADKKQDAKKHKQSLLGRVVSGAKELKATLTTAAHIAKNPSQSKKNLLQRAAQRLATSKNVSTRVETQDKDLIGYPDLLELLDLVQAQDSEFHIASNIQKILEAIDTALNAHYKNPHILFSLQDIETVLQWFYPDMTVSQHGSHKTYHFLGMPAITIATHKDNQIFKKALQSVQNRIREALLKKLGIKSCPPSAEDLTPPPTDIPPAERKDESSEEEGLYES